MVNFASLLDPFTAQLSGGGGELDFLNKWQPSSASTLFMLCEYFDAAIISLCKKDSDSGCHWFDLTLTSHWRHSSHISTQTLFQRDRNHIRSHEAQSRRAGSIISGARLTLPCSCTRQTLPGHLPWQCTSYPVNHRAWHPPISDELPV